MPVFYGVSLLLVTSQKAVKEQEWAQALCPQRPVVRGSGFPALAHVLLCHCCFPHENPGHSLLPATE